MFWCAFLHRTLADLGEGGGEGGVGYIGTRWWAAAVCGGLRPSDCPSFTIRSFISWSQPVSSAEPRGTKPCKINSEGSVRKGRWALGPFGGRVGVTWEGSPCNGCLWASVVSAAASSTS